MDKTQKEKSWEDLACQGARAMGEAMIDEKQWFYVECEERCTYIKCKEVRVQDKKTIKADGVTIEFDSEITMPEPITRVGPLY